MIDIKLIRTNPDLVKENIKKKFQDEKLPLVDEVLELDEKFRKIKLESDNLRSQRNTLSSQIGQLMREKKVEEANKIKEQVVEINNKIAENDVVSDQLANRIKEIMFTIPNIIDDTVPIGKDDSENVEIRRYLTPKTPDFEVPYHIDIIERIGGIDLDGARKVSGSGFYYLEGDFARLHSAVTSYARDFMIDKGFTYCVPPFMVRSEVVNGVMSFKEMDDMMYKIEGEDLYLIGTSEHSMIGKFIDTILEKDNLPYKYTSYSPCFRKEKELTV